MLNYLKYLNRIILFLSLILSTQGSIGEFRTWTPLASDSRNNTNTGLQTEYCVVFQELTPYSDEGATRTTNAQRYNQQVTDSITKPEIVIDPSDTLEIFNVYDSVSIGSDTTAIIVSNKRISWVRPAHLLPGNRDNMVLVEGGLCWVGNIPDGFGNKILHDNCVHIDSFWIDKYEVTNADYAAFLSDDNDRYHHIEMHIELREDSLYYPYEGMGRHPVTYVDWIGAMAYAKWVGKRLPTEEEWEKAARGVSEQSISLKGVNIGFQYTWGDSPPDSTIINMLFTTPHSHITTTPAGFYDGSIRDGITTKSNASSYGAFDMAGNVWEWTSSGYSPWENTPSIESCEKLRVVRGGSWREPMENVKTTTRSYRVVDYTANDLGFRCCISVKAADKILLHNEDNTN